MKRLRGLRIEQIVVLLAVPVLVYLSVASVTKAFQTYQLQAEERRLRQEIARLEVQNRELQKQIDYLKSDAYVEKIAREQLNLIKPGETAVVVLSPTPVPTPIAAPAAKPPPTRLARTNWELWWDYFFGPR